jgi:hypothetical protein
MQNIKKEIKNLKETNNENKIVEGERKRKE